MLLVTTTNISWVFFWLSCFVTCRSTWPTLACLHIAPAGFLLYIRLHFVVSSQQSRTNIMTSLTFLWLILCRGTSYSRIMGCVIHMVKLAVFVAHIASNCARAKKAEYGALTVLRQTGLWGVRRDRAQYRFLSVSAPLAKRSCFIS